MELFIAEVTNFVHSSIVGLSQPGSHQTQLTLSLLFIFTDETIFYILMPTQISNICAGQQDFSECCSRKIVEHILAQSLAFGASKSPDTRGNFTHCSKHFWSTYQKSLNVIGDGVPNIVTQ